MRAFRPPLGKSSRRRLPPVLLPVLLIVSALALAGCETAEERAEGYYQRGMALLAEGDADRALVEFRNVFRLNGAHVPARLEYANALRDRGETREAFGQYLRLVDLDPRNVEARRALTELALQAQDFATAEEHATRAFALAPGDPGVRALKAMVDFRRGEDKAAALEMARGVIEEAPGNVAAHMVVIAERLDAGAPAEALPLVEAALAQAPGDEDLHLARLAVLEALGDTAASGDQLRRMAELFPDNEGVRQALIQWYLRTDDPAGAEAVLREMAARDPDDPAPALTIVRFLMEIEGPEAARDELETRIAAAADPRPFQQALARLDFAQGRGAEAIAALRALTESAEPSDAARDLQVTLAGMLAETGEAEESAALIATVLAEDPGHVAALKLRAEAAIAADRPEAAIQDMRAALAQAPRDPEIMTIMARAHEREGSRELAGERLALAVEASNRAPDTSLRYARFLMRDDRTGPAESVIVSALRRTPADPDLLAMLGRIHLARRDWSRAAQVAEALRAQDDPAAARQAAEIEAASLRGQNRSEEAIALLEALAESGDNAQATARLIQTHLQAGDLDAAERALGTMLAKDPESLPGRLLRAGLLGLRGETEAAEAAYRAVVADAPGEAAGHRALFAWLDGQGRRAEARAALEAGIEAAPGSAELKLAKATLLEAEGDIAGAIALYEELYARDSASPMLANNLASLLASYRDDPASLERAFAIARRLRGSDVPYFQDTYGWILHRRGDSEAALRVLEPAAEALPENALVQFHRAEAERAAGRLDAARESYARARAASEAGSPLPPEADISARLAELDAGGAAAPAPGATRLEPDEG